jgi:hypothetical protein
MDTTTLVTNRIDDGRRLLAELVNRGVDVTVAGWLESGEESRWHLYIASKLVEEKGLAPAYSQVYGILDTLDAVRISMWDVKLIDPSGPVARDLLAIQQGHSGSPVVVQERVEVGPFMAEQAYIYPPLHRPKESAVERGKRRLKTTVEQTQQLDRMLAPLSPQEEQALNQILDLGVSRAQAEFWVRRKRELERERPPIPAGTIVTASVAGWWGSNPADDPNPLLLVEAPDGATGLTFEANTEPV